MVAYRARRGAFAGRRSPDGLFAADAALLTANWLWDQERWSEAALASLALGDGLSEARTRIENGYHVVESLAEYAQEYIEDTGLEIPSFIHVDWEATGRDLAMDMSEVRMGGMLYLFGP